MRSRFDVFEDYVELAKQGFSREVIADRLGMKLTSMEKALQRIANENNMEVPYVPKRF
jgi:hypothetical protein